MEQGLAYFQLAELAARTASTERLVALGMQWLVSSGQAQVIKRDQSGYTLAPGGVVDIAQRASLQQDMHRAFREIHSFSQYLKRVDLDRLVDELS